MLTNPYSPVFGEEPLRKIPREDEIANIINDFTSEYPPRKNTMIIGVRGSGKTVFMTEVSDRLKAMEDWIVIKLNPTRNLLEDLLHKLANHKKVSSIVSISKINLSFFGINVELKDEYPITNIEVAIQEILEQIKKQKKKVLITVDEVSNTIQAKEFFGSYQIFLSEKLPLFFLGTGLYENVQRLKNEKDMTFLYRMPRIELKSLSINSIADDYEENLKVKRDTAFLMAMSTMGYSFAFQSLGYFYFQEFMIRKTNDLDRVGILFRNKLTEDAYTKIWEDMSLKDRELAVAMATVESGRISDLINHLGWDKNYLNQYRTRLIKSGIASGEVWGKLSFSIPLFKDFVLEQEGTL